MPEISKTNLNRIFSPFVFLLIWYILSFCIKAPLILPYPHTVFFRLCALVKTAAFWKNFAFTFLRVIIAFVITFLLGFTAGLLSADYPAFKAFLSFPLAVIRVTPVISFILIALFWFKSGSVPVFVAVLMSLPVMISGAEKGFEKNQENLEKQFKAKSRGLTGFKAFRYIRLPAALPALMAGCEASFGLSWKVVAAGEVLSIPRFAAGSLMQLAQVHLETANVLAITITLVIISYICQHLLTWIASKISSKNNKKTL